MKYFVSPAKKENITVNHELKFGFSVCSFQYTYANSTSDETSVLKRKHKNPKSKLRRKISDGGIIFDQKQNMQLFLSISI